MLDSSYSVALEIESQLRDLGQHPLTPKSLVRGTGRSRVFTLQTTEGLLWIKHSYQLPPGEGAVVEKLRERWQHYLPTVVIASSFTLVTETIPGEELMPEHPQHEWVQDASALGEIACGET